MRRAKDGRKLALDAEEVVPEDVAKAGGASSEVFDGPLVRRDELIFGGRRFIQPRERDQIAPVRYRDVPRPPARVARLFR